MRFGCGAVGAVCGAGADFEPTAPRMPSDISDMKILSDQKSNLHHSNHAELFYLQPKPYCRMEFQERRLQRDVDISPTQKNSKTLAYDKFSSVKWLMICSGYY